MSVEYSLCALTRVVLTTLENVVQLRIDSLGVPVEDRGPIQARKAISEALRLGHVLDRQKDVVVLRSAASGRARKFNRDRASPNVSGLIVQGKHRFRASRSRPLPLHGRSSNRTGRSPASGPRTRPHAVTTTRRAQVESGARGPSGLVGSRREATRIASRLPAERAPRCSVPWRIAASSMSQ